MERYDSDNLLDLLYDILLCHPLGVKEYDLLNILREMELPVFSAGKFSDTLVLFRAHFMLFHLLYRLRDRLHREGKGDMEIHCLKVILRPRQETDPCLPARPDSLGEYYLDLANMEEMKQVDVEELIERFWKEYALFQARPAGLTVLGLSAPASRAEIKRRYRELALRHHPDQGGNPEDFQKISTAARDLLQTSL